MTEAKSRKRLIHSIQEFEKTYLPKATKELEMPVGNKMNGFGVNLTKRITSRIDVKV